MTSTITIRLEDSVKEQLEALIDDLGMNMSSFFGVYAKQAIRDQAIPFTINNNAGNYDVLKDKAVVRMLKEQLANVKVGSGESIEELRAWLANEELI